MVRDRPGILCYCLPMISPIRVAPGVTIPPCAVEVTAVRSTGPGGQNVNKVATKVQLRVDLGRIEGLSADARRRLVSLAGRRIDAEGKLVVTSQRTRDRLLNLADALGKVRGLVARALVAPRPRRPTRPTKGSVRRRVEAKRQRGERKQQRRLPGEE